MDKCSLLFLAGFFLCLVLGILLMAVRMRWMEMTRKRAERRLGITETKITYDGRKAKVE